MSANSAPIPTPRLTLRTYTQGDTTVVQCTGKLSAGVTDILYAEVKGLIPHAKRIVLDLTDLTYMDSSGLGTIIGLYVSAKAAGCDLSPINLSKRIRELFSITNVLSLFEACAEYNVKIP